MLSLTASPLCILQPNPLQAPTPYELAASKYPFASLRKSLRLLIDDDNVDELENDISYVYSGYAPVSVRLVQCVAQKGGVLSNPASDKVGGPEGESTDGTADSSSGTMKVQAHPIVGWKGFEDVLASIPGETVDFVPKGLVPMGEVNPGSIVRSTNRGIVPFFLWTYLAISASSREKTKTTTVFFLGGCTYTEIAAIRWVAKQNRGRWLTQCLYCADRFWSIGRRFLIATTGIISGRSVVERIAGISPGGGRDASI